MMMYHQTNTGFKTISSSEDIAKAANFDHMSPHSDNLQDSKPVFLHDTLSHDDAPQYNEVGIAQLVEHPTEKPGTILTQLPVPGAARDFFLPAPTSSEDSYSVRTAPVCNRMHQHL